MSARRRRSAWRRRMLRAAGGDREHVRTVERMLDAVATGWRWKRIARVVDWREAA
jgi:hypothetical protein